MSIEKLRQLKLYKKLQKDLTYREKLQQKIKQISNHMPSVRQSSSASLSKINNNKKYLMEQQKNAQIQRHNRILFQKIQSNATKSHYKGVAKKNKSSQHLKSVQDSDTQTRNSGKYKNWSQNKISSGQQQSRISFQQSQQMMRPKQTKSKSNKMKMKMLTQLSPQIIDILKSRMIENRTITNEKQQNETVLFQGVGQIDTIKFKVKIFIKNKTYYLMGRNKHTQIMLKMELNQYKKFHKQVLRGNPSNVFKYLKIDKGQIRFRTRQQQQEEGKMKELQQRNKKSIYRIQQEEQNEDLNQQGSFYPKGFEKSTIQKAKNNRQDYFNSNSNKINFQRQKQNKQADNQENYDKLTKKYEKENKKINKIYDEQQLQNDIIEKITIHKKNKKNNSKSIDNSRKNDFIQEKYQRVRKQMNPQQYENMLKSNKYNNTLEDYISNENMSNKNEDRKNAKGSIYNYSQKVEVQGKSMKTNRYKLPYL